ncbi:MAG: FKBP-type peptidyl-prolyl cis-trans isomerase [Bryobacterales bacterium]|nr:FKBP-type peptidyl-prolyl cis-trans isomerase [Bryobacterales bacterium]
MKKKPQRIETLTHIGLILALIAGTLAAQGAGDRAGPAAALDNIEISLKVDPRLTKGLYMGDRWVSAPTYIGTAGQDNVDARVQGVYAGGKKTAISPQWIPSDPEMVTVSPGQGSEVKITVKRAGESRLEVKAGGVSKELAIKAAYKGESIQVEIAQLETEAPAGAGRAPAFKSQKEKLSYALGMTLVSQLRSQRVELDADSYSQGFRDALSGGKTLLTETEASVELMEMQNRVRTKHGAQAEKLKGLGEKNRNEGEVFLAGNKAQEGVVTLESGLQYKILKAGDEKKPTADDTVVCHYRGALIDGTEFDSSYKRSKPASFAVNKVIKGWTEALQLMPVGSKWQLFIPSSLAYGARGAPGGKIGPNSTLIFEVELISIQSKS